MKVGTAVLYDAGAAVAEAARIAEDLGYDFLASTETSHNPFVPLVLAAEHTRRVRLKTSIALAFVRSPMDLAYMAWDLQSLSEGRFVLGLGSQVRGHVVRRFGMSWTPPAARMRDYVRALRAVWDCWQHGSTLDFKSESYSLNLMTPYFNPGPVEDPDIQVHLAAVNPRMLQVAGEVGDGVILHPFCSQKYTDDVVLPNLETGAARSGRTLKDLEIAAGGLVAYAAGHTDVDAAVETVRARIAFYASTPSYGRVMQVHGWQDTAVKLHRMSVDGRWSDMASEVSDEMLEAFAVIGTDDDIASKLVARHGAYAGSMLLPTPVGETKQEERTRSVIRELHAV